MRYYNITITPAAGGGPIAKWTSSTTGSPSGDAILGAQLVELDLPYTTLNVPINQGGVTIHGVEPIYLGPQNNFTGQNVSIFGGMMTGLPLATAQVPNAGLLVTGTIFQAFGNWIGTDRTLTLILMPRIGTQNDPVNLVLDWPKGGDLATAIKNALVQAFPKYKPPSINISPLLINPNGDEKEYYTDVGAMAAAVNAFSLAIIQPGATSVPMFTSITVTTPPYSGVQITLKNNQFFVYDNRSTAPTPGNTTQTNPKKIEYTDLIGQPTWFNFAIISFNTVMRSDISIGDYIKMPSTVQTNTAASTPTWRSSSAFQGTFQVTMGRHVGNSRQADGSSWITNFQAVSLDPGNYPQQPGSTPDPNPSQRPFYRF